MAESTNNLQKVLNSQASDEVLKRVTLKKDVLGAKKLFEATAQVPSPSKDFTQIVITERGMVWRKWKISLRGVSQGAVPQPSEEVMLHEDFQYDTNLQGDVERIFGEEVLRRIQRILAGSYDALSLLPEKLSLKVCSYLDLQSIAQLSQVNRHLREVCNSNQLWESLYYDHQGIPNDEVIGLAKEVTWKKVFFMNKLQLQKELSRRRRMNSSSPQHQPQAGGNQAKQSPSTTFLTEGF